MPQKWLGWDEPATLGSSNDNLYHTWTKASSSTSWGFSTPISSPVQRLTPPSQISPERTASEAETISTGGSRRVSPTGPSIPLQSPEKYFQQTLMPKAPSRTRSSFDPVSPHVASSQYATSYTTASTPKNPQSGSPQTTNPGPPTKQTARAAGVECEECKSKDSFVGGSCQICGHESLLHSLTARRAPSLHSYSYSYSGRSQSSYSSFRSSIGGENCPDCKSHNSIHLGSCQVCGFSFSACQSEVVSFPHHLLLTLEHSWVGLKSFLCPLHLNPTGDSKCSLSCKLYPLSTSVSFAKLRSLKVEIDTRAGDRSREALHFRV